MKITPFILGSGKAASAILESLRVIEIIHPQMSLLPVIKLKRGEEFPSVDHLEFPVLFIANPHALHAEAIIQGEEKGFKLIVSEKPTAINLEQINSLKKIIVPVAVLHVYRQTWGLLRLKEMILNNEFGEIISLEGRYWQSSTAQRALLNQKTESWKNNPTLSGESDVLADLTCHWADAAIYLAGSQPMETKVWRSFVNAEAPHRDTHLHLQMNFAHTRALCSVSKTVHGYGNHFEINIIGSQKYGAWKFSDPDVLEISQGSVRSFISRNTMTIGARHWPYHSLGWLEGYIEIIYQALKGGVYPTLRENLLVMEELLKASK